MRAREPIAGARTILVIRHRAGGDLLLTTPALAAIRSGSPGARIDVLAARGLGALLEGNPDVDRVIEFDRRSLLSSAALYARLARGGYDVVFDMVSNPRSAWMTGLTRAPVRIGYDIAGRRRAYTIRVPREPLGPGGRPALRYAPEAALDQVRAAGLPAGDTALRFRVSPEAAGRLAKWLDDPSTPRDRSKPLVACLPAGSWPAKTWPAERFVEAMERLAGDATIVWLWGPGEEALARSCRERMSAPSLLAPKTGWQELGALLARCALLVCNDSGPKHVAVALGVPTVTIFGPTHPATWHPPAGPHTALQADGLDCLHCNANRCPLPGDRFLRCMRDVGVERVSAAARACLDAAGARAAPGAGGARAALQEARCASG
ncbi:MAG TPA: glycosyltransferase family 9 protein [Candidatus Eisenbacteria bacterium]